MNEIYLRFANALQNFLPQITASDDFVPEVEDAVFDQLILNIANTISPFSIENTGMYVVPVLNVLFVIFISVISFFIAVKLFIPSIHLIIKKSTISWDDYLIKYQVFEKLFRIIPFIVLYLQSNLFPDFKIILQKISLIAITLIIMNTINALSNVLIDVYRGYSSSIKKPIKGYIQIAKILVSCLGYILIVSIIIDKNPSTIIAGLGAMTAILLLVFKDSIMGLVASVQISSNNLVKLGDWIEMPKYGADGDVIDVSLHTVKVQNWDKTITSIPTYALISDSFKNWRGMSESDGRRIKRSLSVDLNSIKFCNDELLGKLKKIDLIQDFIEQKIGEINEHNDKTVTNREVKTNGRCLTNIGLFRQYTVAYLKNNPIISDTMTFLVRQLPPNQYGVPLEIYVFSKDQDWGNYENIQADIFDHLFASIQDFELNLFQNPSGKDFASLNSN
jgi:miniconductance mechanosensitive channel